jgi:hypothetical protein
MLLKEIERNPIQSLSYMERLVNNGSKSMFTFENTVSRETNPLYTREFCLTEGKNDSAEILSFGDLHEELCELKLAGSVFVHPDWKYTKSSFSLEQSKAIVEPTASQRTVKVKYLPYYIKMAHPFILGRITRELEIKHILSSIDITCILNSSYLNAPEKFAFFPESGGQILKTNEAEIGYIIRSAKPVGKNVDKIKYLIPGFSLFSVDKRREDEPLLIQQILSNKIDKKGFILNEIIFPLIDCFFYYVFSEGIQFELHAQNILFGVDSNFNIASCVIRDFESADKDMTIRTALGKEYALLSSPFKCISDKQYNYKIKHSFMYDHKLCEYFIDQLLLSVTDELGITIDILRNSIKEEVIYLYANQLNNFFPEDGCWYKFEEKTIHRTIPVRPYRSIPSPYFR